MILSLVQALGKLVLGLLRLKDLSHAVAAAAPGIGLPSGPQMYIGSLFPPALVGEETEAFLLLFLDGVLTTDSSNQMTSVSYI